MNNIQFEDHSAQGSELVTWQSGPFLFGFGKKNLSMDALSKRYPDFKWEHLKQIHSAKIVESTKASDPRSAQGAYALVEADAHFTVVPNLATVVKTADCVPVLIAAASGEADLRSGRPHAVCAIHAGWRGVATDIVQNSVRALLERGYAPTRMIVALGPHIRVKSFEVGLDVARDLKAAAKRAGVGDPQSVIYEHPSNSAKRKVDLETIVRHQLMMFQIPSTSIHSLPIDTLTSADWASFRREGANAGRNLSFVVYR